MGASMGDLSGQRLAQAMEDREHRQVKDAAKEDRERHQVKDTTEVDRE